MKHRLLVQLISTVTVGTILSLLIKIYISKNFQLVSLIVMFGIVNSFGVNYFNSRSKGVDSHFISTSAYENDSEKSKFKHDVGVLLIILISIIVTWLFFLK
jgi:hypothetical protein